MIIKLLTVIEKRHARALHKLRGKRGPCQDNEAEQVEPRERRSLFDLGDEFVVGPDMVRQHVFAACGGSLSYLKCIEDVEAGRLPLPSLGQLWVSANPEFKTLAVRKFKAENLICCQTHFCNCKTRDAEFYNDAVALGLQITEFVTNRCEKENWNGNMLLRFTAEYRMEDGTANVQHIHCLMCLLMKKAKTQQQNNNKKATAKQETHTGQATCPGYGG